MPASTCVSPGETEPRGFLSFRHERHLAPSASANAYLCPSDAAAVSYRLFPRRRAIARRVSPPALIRRIGRNLSACDLARSIRKAAGIGRICPARAA
jgi:hypothetical protein